MRRVAALALAFAGLAAGCGEDDDSTSAAADEGCPAAELPAPKDLDLKPPPRDEPTASGVEFSTSCGSFTVSFDPRSPETAASMQYLAEEGAYDDTAVHRVIAGKLVQAGDPLGSDPDRAGTGGPGYFVDEPPPRSLAYTQGVVAMAKTAAEPIGRSGSQFFVVVQADAGLTPDFALVGEISDGFEVVERISRSGDPAADGPPLDPVVIESAEPVDG